MSWNGGADSSGWAPGQSNFYAAGSGNTMQPHYANAYHAQGGYYAQPAVSQSMQITVPSPGFARNQPMASIVPMHMRNRVGAAWCGHEGCLFAGSHKEVEVHKMDRHLVFPPGWQEGQAKGKRKRGKERDEGGVEEYVDEEAQFRGNGSAAILGTDTKLDSPEAIAAWVEDRKKRWPSAKRVTEKVQSRQEALERGQIIAEPQRLRRPTTEGDRGRGTYPRRGRGRGRGRGREFTQHNIDARAAPDARQPGVPDLGWAGRARGRGRGASRGNGTGFERGRGRGRGRGGAVHPAPSVSAANGLKRNVEAVSGSSSSTSTGSSSDSDSDSGSDSDDGSDMDPVRDAVSSKAAQAESVSMEVDQVENDKAAEGEMGEPIPNQTDTQTRKQPIKKRTVQPPKPVYNPFNQRPDLLRNLLMPDIQTTVSNLSQAIRFLVANNFLDNVELKPGDAEDVPIQPMDAGPTESSVTP